jgi:hypothetical protein
MASHAHPQPRTLLRRLAALRPGRPTALACTLALALAAADGPPTTSATQAVDRATTSAPTRLGQPATHRGTGHERPRETPRTTRPDTKPPDPQEELHHDHQATLTHGLARDRGGVRRSRRAGQRLDGRDAGELRHLHLAGGDVRRGAGARVDAVLRPDRPQRRRVDQPARRRQGRPGLRNRGLIQQTHPGEPARQRTPDGPDSRQGALNEHICARPHR